MTFNSILDILKPLGWWSEKEYYDSFNSILDIPESKEHTGFRDSEIDFQFYFRYSGAPTTGTILTAVTPFNSILDILHG